eukprot:Lankesteria_metandrocarpae@DN5490_c0_g1_i1.p1
MAMRNITKLQVDLRQHIALIEREDWEAETLKAKQRMQQQFTGGPPRGAFNDNRPAFRDRSSTRKWERPCDFDPQRNSQFKDSRGPIGGGLQASGDFGRGRRQYQFIPRGAGGGHSRSREPMPPPERLQMRSTAGQLDCSIRFVKSLLNKLTVDKFIEICEATGECFCGFKTSEELSSAAFEVFDRAVTEPTFNVMYADLIVVLTGKNYVLRRTFLNLAQDEYDGLSKYRDDSTIPATLSAEDREIELVRRKKRVLGNMGLMGELFLRRVVPRTVVINNLSNLLKLEQTNPQPPEEYCVECVCRILTTIGGVTNFEFASFMSTLLNLKESGHYSKRIQFMIQDLSDLAESGWKKKAKEQPKALKEIRREWMSQMQGGHVNVHQPATVGYGRASQPYDEYFNKWSNVYACYKKTVRQKQSTEQSRETAAESRTAIIPPINTLELPSNDGTAAASIAALGTGSVAPSGGSSARSSVEAMGDVSSLNAPTDANRKSSYASSTACQDDDALLEGDPVAVSSESDDDSDERVMGIGTTSISRILGIFHEERNRNNFVQDWDNLGLDNSVTEHALKKTVEYIPSDHVAIALALLILHNKVSDEFATEMLSNHVEWLQDYALDNPRAPEDFGLLMGVLWAGGAKQVQNLNFAEYSKDFLAQLLYIFLKHLKIEASGDPELLKSGYESCLKWLKVVECDETEFLVMIARSTLGGEKWASTVIGMDDYPVSCAALEAAQVQHDSALNDLAQHDTAY